MMLQLLAFVQVGSMLPMATLSQGQVLPLPGLDSHPVAATGRLSPVMGCLSPAGCSSANQEGAQAGQAVHQAHNTVANRQTPIPLAAGKQAVQPE